MKRKQVEAVVILQTNDSVLAVSSYHLYLKGREPNTIFSKLRKCKYSEPTLFNGVELCLYPVGTIRMRQRGGIKFRNISMT